jgi:hypothetical protein
MDQGLIVVFLHLKGLSVKAKDFDTGFAEILGSDPIAYSTATKYL